MELEKKYSCLTKNRLVINRSVNVDKNYQETLEAYLEDLHRVIRCECHSYVTSCDIVDSTAVVEGKSEICLTYTNADGELLYTEFIEDFTEKTALDSLSEFAFVVGDISDKYTNFRVINQRRIDIHTSFCLNLKVYDKISCPCVNECDGSRLNSYSVKEQNVKNYILRKLEIDEEFSIPDNSNGIKRVFCYDINPCVTDSKAINDKIFIKVKVDTKVLYTDNDNKTCCAKYTFDVSKICDISGIDENSKCFIKINEGSLFVKAKSSADDTGGRIELYGDIYACITVVNEIDSTIVTDGYIVGYQVENNYSSYLCSKKCDDLTVKKNERLTLKINSEIKSVLDLSLKINECVCKNKKIIIQISFRLMYTNAEGKTEFFEEIKELEHSINNSDILCAVAEIKSYDYNIVSDCSVDVNLNYEIISAMAVQEEIRVLSDILCDDNVVKAPALTLYFAKTGERLWDIAKSFSSDIDLIKKENELTDDKLESNKIIVIPGL